MPRETWISVSLKEELIKKVDAEIEIDPVFPSRSSLITHAVINYLERKTRRD